MATFSEHSCRLCLNFKADDVIDNFTRDVFSVLSLNLELDESKTYVMCTTCSGKLKAALEFKSICLATGDTIYPYIDCVKELQLDLREIYMKETENEQEIDLPSDQNVCSLCMQIAGDEFVAIYEEEVKAIHRFVPEMNMGVIKDPVVCKRCYDSLHTHTSFLNDCLETDKKIGRICDNTGTTGLNVQSFDLFIETYDNVEVIKNENEKEEGNLEEKRHIQSLNSSLIVNDFKTEVEEFEKMLIKSENIELKFEEKQQSSNTHLVDLKKEIMKSDICSTKTELNHSLELEMDLSCSDQLDTQVHNEQKKEDILEIHPHILKYDNLESSDLTQNHLPLVETNKSDSNAEIFKCEECEYQSTCKRYFRAHQMRHERRKGGQTYQCGKCYFHTPSWKSLRVHEVTHKEPKEPKEAQVYKCESCEYETTVRMSFQWHQLMHEEHKGTKIFKCDQCDYRSKKKKGLNSHRMRHEDRKETRLYICDICQYQSRVRMNFREHMLRHEEARGTQMYKCDKCEYESKLKKNFYKHQLRHEDSEDAQMYKSCTNMSTIEIINVL